MRINIPLMQIKGNKFFFSRGIKENKYGLRLNVRLKGSNRIGNSSPYLFTKSTTALFRFVSKSNGPQLARFLLLKRLGPFPCTSHNSKKQLRSPAPRWRNKPPSQRPKAPGNPRTKRRARSHGEEPQQEQSQEGRRRCPHGHLRGRARHIHRHRNPAA